MADASKLELKQHRWTAMRFVPVSVIWENGEPHIFHTDEVDERVGCIDCNTGLSPETFDTPCLGEDLGPIDG